MRNLRKALSFSLANRTIVGNTPAFAPDLVLKGGISFQRDHCFNIALMAVYISQQFWQDANIGSPAIPKGKIPAYSVFNLSGEFYVTKNLRLIGGISNLTDAKYYNRVFANGIETRPALFRLRWLVPVILTEAHAGENSKS